MHFLHVKEMKTDIYGASCSSPSSYVSIRREVVVGEGGEDDNGQGGGEVGEQDRGRRSYRKKE